MLFHLERPSPSRIAKIQLISSTKPRACRRFLPQHFVLLEERAMLSAIVAPPPAPSPVPAPTPGETGHNSSPRTGGDHAGQPGRNHTTGSSAWTELQNVSFPTVNGQSELLDVYSPEGSAPAGGRPVIVAIHGGAWRRLDKDAYGRRVAEGFVHEGYVVVAPNYVLSSPGNPTWPVNFEDVQAAVRWVRSDAPTLGINPNEIVAMGESAGANLAASLGTYSTQNTTVDGVSAAVDAVVAVSTPADLTTLYTESRVGGPAAAEFLGGSPEQVPANYIAASPIDHVSEGDPPMLLIHGLQDHVIPVSQSQELAAALSTAGVRNELFLVNGGHGLDFPTQYSYLVPDVLEFLSATWNY
jgi:acetyl esterase/lipase